jgi:PKD domain
MKSRQLLPVGACTLALLACATDTDRTVSERLTAPDAPPSSAAIVPLATATTAWYQSPGGVAVANDAADNVYTARWDYNPAGDIYLAKRDQNGTLIWEVRYDNTDNTRHEVATWVETDPSGNVFVSGTIRSGYSNPVNANSLLMKFSPSGALLWRRVYGNPFDGSSTRKVLVDATGAAYVFGLGMAPSGQRTTVRKFMPDGSTGWIWFDPVGVGGPLNIKWGADGHLVIAARAIFGSINGYAKVDRSGTTLWTLAGVQSLTVGDIAGDAAGNSYIINGNYTTGSGSFLRKLGPTAQLLWQRGSPVGGQRVEVGTDNAPVVGGYPSAGFGAAFTKFDANGNLLWTNLDADGPSTNLLAHGIMMLDAANNAFIAASNMSQMGVVKVLAATGASDWMLLIPFGYATDLAFGQQQRVFVTGGGTVARIDQQGAPPPVNTPPVATVVATTPTTIPVGGSVQVQATLVDPDVGDGPWPYTWRFGNGRITGTRLTPGTFGATRTYPFPGSYRISLIVTDARGAVDTSNVINVTVR